jgi:hypothetical protein
VWLSAGTWLPSPGGCWDAATGRTTRGWDAVDGGAELAVDGTTVVVVVEVVVEVVVVEDVVAVVVRVVGGTVVGGASVVGGRYGPGGDGDDGWVGGRVDGDAVGCVGIPVVVDPVEPVAVAAGCSQCSDRVSDDSTWPDSLSVVSSVRRVTSAVGDPPDDVAGASESSK